jgi:hypothetical protein
MMMVMAAVVVVSAQIQNKLTENQLFASCVSCNLCIKEGETVEPFNRVSPWILIPLFFQICHIRIHGYP